MAIGIYQIKNNDKIFRTDYFIDTDENLDFQFGDSHTDKIKLSNGDIVFNNFGDVNSCLIFTRNSPKIEIYTENLDSAESVK
jgi:hypothetical protein